MIGLNILLNIMEKLKHGVVYQALLLFCKLNDAPVVTLNDAITV